MKREDFLNIYRIEEDKEKTMLLKLQREYEDNKISENDMSKEQISKLKILYKEQIEKLKNDFNLYKKKAIKLRTTN